MPKIDLDTFISVPITVELYTAIYNRHPNSVSSIIEHVVTDFLERTEDDFHNTKQEGIYWDPVFLPSGTEIRTKYYGEYKTANIIGEQIIRDNTAYKSMSQLANSMRGNTSNNAWRCLEIKRPQEGKWQATEYLRK